MNSALSPADKKYCLLKHGNSRRVYIVLGELHLYDKLAHLIFVFFNTVALRKTPNILFDKEFYYCCKLSLILLVFDIFRSNFSGVLSITSLLHRCTYSTVVSFVIWLIWVNAKYVKAQ